jgi:four helix bundle protein
MKENIVLEKSFEFSLLVIKYYMTLKDQKEYDLARQFLKSGTAIGANIEEAQGAQSKNDFIAKISIAHKEARECHYWLRLFKESEFIGEESINNLIEKCIELNKLLTSILISSKV